MKNIIYILILCFVSLTVKAQLPNTLPNPKSNAFAQYGYLKTDSANIIAIRDTLWRPKFGGTMVMWPRTGIDTTFWFWDLRKWNRTLSASDTVSIYARITALRTAYNNVAFDTSSRILTLYRFNGDSSTVIIPGGSGGGGGGGGLVYKKVNSVDFANDTAYINSTLLGSQYLIYWNEANRFLYQNGDDVSLNEWHYNAGGGFTITIPGFNATGNNYHFYLFLLSGSGGGGGTVPNDKTYTSANFTNATDLNDPTISGQRFRLVYYGIGTLLLGTQWEIIPTGGFKILIPGFNVATDVTNKFTVQFY